MRLGKRQLYLTRGFACAHSQQVLLIPFPPALGQDFFTSTVTYIIWGETMTGQVLKTGNSIQHCPIQGQRRWR